MTWKTSGIAMFALSIWHFWIGGNDMQVLGPLFAGLFCMAIHSILRVLQGGTASGR